MAKVAIIGAGAAGLVSARELKRQDHQFQVFEQSDQIGGVWVYSEEVEDDPLSLNSTTRIHGSLYESLTTNLPVGLMAFEDFPFSDHDDGAFVHHAVVLKYLKDYATEHQLGDAIRLNHTVKQVGLENDKWLVDGEPFDAVMVCNGHYAKVNVPEIPGIQSFPGLCLHSHNYRTPKAFKNKRVVVFGTSASGFDLSRELSSNANTVYLVGNGFDSRPGLTTLFDGAVLTGNTIESIDGNTIYLADGVAIRAVDALLFCTGYQYEFPFLSDRYVQIRNNHVGNLYKQLIANRYTNLAFIGLPFRIVPFPLFQCQARWFCRLLSCDFELPTLVNRNKQYRKEIEGFEAGEVPVRHFHLLGENQLDYMNDLALECGDESLSGSFVEMWQNHRKRLRRFSN